MTGLEITNSYMPENGYIWKQNSGKSITSFAKLPAGALSQSNTSWIVFRRIGQSLDLKDVPSNVQFRDWANITTEVSSTMARDEFTSGKVSSYYRIDLFGKL